MRKVVIHIPGDRTNEILKQMDSQYKSEWEFSLQTPDDLPKRGISNAFKSVIIQNYTNDSVLVFEDDVRFTRYDSRLVFDDNFNKMALENPDWDIFLGGSYLNDDQANQIQWFKGYGKCNSFRSLHCVIFRKTIYDKILLHDGSNDLDLYLSKMSESGEIKVFISDPQICIQAPGYSYNRKKEVNYKSYLKNMNVLK